MTPTKEDVIKHLTQLRNTLAHSLRQPHISPARFNEIREQLVPLDAELHKLGVDTEPTPQMNPAFVGRRQTRRDVHNKKRSKKWSKITMQRFALARSARGDE